MLGACCIKDRLYVGDALLKSGELRDRVRQACARLVVDDQTRERGQARQKARDPRVGPLEIKVGNEAVRDDQVDRTVADNLVGDRGPVSLDVLRLRRLHRTSLGSASTLRELRHRLCAAMNRRPDTLLLLQNKREQNQRNRALASWRKRSRPR